MPSQTDFVIVGQGLAGTALAWHLFRRGRRVLVVDRERGGCSRVAAGLITSVTGKRLAKSRRWEELFPSAVAFYRAREADLATTFFHQRDALRFFANESERAQFASLPQDLVRPATDVSGEWFDAPFGGFEMTAARLDVARYLDASREHFRAGGAYLAAEVEPSELEFSTAGVRVPALAVTAGAVVLCRGFASDADPWFGAIKFNAAKGQILTVRVPGLAEERVVHRGAWLAPAGAGAFRAGATYSWNPLDATPTDTGCAEIETRLRKFLRLPFEVIGHSAGVRPIIEAGAPVLGRHPAAPRLAYFNGLGSKGALLAPFFAGQLAAHLCDGAPVDDRVSVARFL